MVGQRLNIRKRTPGHQSHGLKSQLLRKGQTLCPTHEYNRHHDIRGIYRYQGPHRSALMVCSDNQDFEANTSHLNSSTSFFQPLDDETTVGVGLTPQSPASTAVLEILFPSHEALTSLYDPRGTCRINPAQHGVH